MIIKSEKKIITKVFSQLSKIKFKKKIKSFKKEKFQEISATQIVNKIKKPDCILIDVRCPNVFNGWTLGKDIVGGHICGAVNFPLAWIDFKGTQIKKTLKRKGITPGKQLIVYGENEKEILKFANYLCLTQKIPLDDIFIYPFAFSTLSRSGLFLIERLKNYENLVHPVWINDLIHDKNPETYQGNKYRILDVSKLRKYKKGHIPGATHLDIEKLETKPLWNIVPKDELKRLFLKQGITKDTLVIIYGENSMAATRVALILMYAGVEDVRILNGGFTAWEHCGLRTQKVVQKPLPVSDFGARIPVNPNYVINTEKTKEILTHINGKLVSIRSLKEQAGKTSGYRYIKPKGRIKGDVWGYGGSNPYSMQDFRNPDQTMRAFGEIKKMWQTSGITSDNLIAFYCGTGWRASEAFFYAYLMGFKHISVYDGGWFEWSRDKTNPIESGDINRNFDSNSYEHPY